MSKRSRDTFEKNESSLPSAKMSTGDRKNKGGYTGGRFDASIIVISGDAGDFVSLRILLRQRRQVQNQRAPFLNAQLASSFLLVVVMAEGMFEGQLGVQKMLMINYLQHHYGGFTTVYVDARDPCDVVLPSIHGWNFGNTEHALVMSPTYSILKAFEVAYFRTDFVYHVSSGSIRNLVCEEVCEEGTLKGTVKVYTALHLKHPGNQYLYELLKKTEGLEYNCQTASKKVVFKSDTRSGGDLLDEFVRLDSYVRDDEFNRVCEKDEFVTILGSINTHESIKQIHPSKLCISYEQNAALDDTQALDDAYTKFLVGETSLRDYATYMCENYFIRREKAVHLGVSLKPLDRAMGETEDNTYSVIAGDAPVREMSSHAVLWDLMVIMPVTGYNGAHAKFKGKSLRKMRESVKKVVRFAMSV